VRQLAPGGRSHGICRERNQGERLSVESYGFDLVGRTVLVHEDDRTALLIDACLGDDALRTEVEARMGEV